MAAIKAKGKGGSGGIAQLWAKAKVEAKNSNYGDAVPLEPGKYKVQLVHGSIGDFGDSRQLMTKFCVVGHESENGTICTLWNSLAEDRIVWTARLLSSMGVDIESENVESEDDLQALVDGLIEGRVVCEGRVATKGEHKNLYINKVVEVDDDDLVDPEEALKAAASARASKSDDDNGEADEPAPAKSGGKGRKPDPEPEPDAGEVVIGSRVSWKDKKTKKTVEGEIVAFDADDNAVIRPDGEKKTVTLPLDDLELVAADPDEPADQPADEPAEPEVEDVVTFKHGGKTKKGVVTAVKSGKVTVKVKGEPKPLVVAVADVEII